jgi:hypothetical protein
MGEGSDGFCLAKYFCSYFPSDFLHSIKSYNMEPPAFLPPLEEGVLHIFIALKNPPPQLGLNLQTLGPMASTPPRQREHSYSVVFCD